VLARAYSAESSHLQKNRGYCDGVNPAQGTTTNPEAPEPEKTHAHDLHQVRSLLNLLPEPIATAFAISAFAGLRHGEIQGLRWEYLRPATFKNGDGTIIELDALWVTRSIWNGREGKTISLGLKATKACSNEHICQFPYICRVPELLRTLVCHSIRLVSIRIHRRCDHGHQEVSVRSSRSPSC
jgi:integrase